MARATTAQGRRRAWLPRGQRSPKNRRRLSPLQVLLRGALIVLAAEGLWTAFHAPQLRVRRVEVVGADRLGAGRVCQLAGIPLGRNIFCVNLYRARLRVESEPLVSSAEVTRALPNAVRILVTERCPVFVVFAGGQFYEADGEGVLFRRVGKPVPKIPLLCLTNVGPVAIGQSLRTEIMKPALLCLRETAANRLLLWKIKVDGPHQLWLNMKVPARPPAPATSLCVRLGRPDDLGLKLADLRKVLAGRPQIVADARYLDVSCAGRPVYMAQASPGSAALPTRGAPSGSVSAGQSPPPKP